jgi:transposase-like protein
MNKIRSSYAPEERRRLVALGVQAGKSNRAIARELEIDEGTVRRDRRYLATPIHERPIRKERPRKIKVPVPIYTLDDRATVIRQKRRVLKVLKQWITEQRMVLYAIEEVLDKASCSFGAGIQ